MTILPLFLLLVAMPALLLAAVTFAVIRWLPRRHHDHLIPTTPRAFRAG